MNNNILVHAEQDIELCKLPNGVTLVEIEQARNRKLAIMMEHINAQYNPRGPAWFNRAFAVLCQNMVQQGMNAVFNASDKQ